MGLLSDVKATMSVISSLSLSGCRRLPADLVRVPFTAAFAVSNCVLRRGGEADGGRVRAESVQNVRARDEDTP